MKAVADFLGDEQDEGAVARLLPKVTDLLTLDETIEYIAVQKRPVVNVSPAAIVLTNRRFMAVRPRMLGTTFEDFPWREVQDVHVSEQMIGATIVCRTTDGRTTSVDSLPKRQARRVYAYAQAVEEQAYEKRQQVELEKLRAGAGGVVLHAPGVPNAPAPVAQATETAQDVMQALEKLKALRAAELITQDEFDAKKAEILARI